MKTRARYSEKMGKSVAHSISQQKGCAGGSCRIVDNRADSASLDHLQLMVDKSGRSTAQQKKLERVTGNIVQRDAYWQTPNNVPTSPFAVANAPIAPYWHRIGGSRNHRLFATQKAAKNAAKSDLNLGGAELRNAFTAQHGGGGAAGGTYTYYTDPGDVNLRVNRTKVLVNHPADPNAQLVNNLGNFVANPANHFHAGLINGQTVTPLTPNPTTIGYVQAPSAAEHYFCM